MASRVNEKLRKQFEMQNNIDVKYAFDLPYTMDGRLEVTLFSYLASNETQTDAFLNEIWNKLGRFANNGGSVFSNAQSIRRMIKSELLKLFPTFKEKCLENDDYCWPIVEKIMRSVLALSLAASRTPSSPGQYLAYHMDTMLGEKSYLSQSTKWPYNGPFNKMPDNLTLELNKYFMDVAFESSNGKLSEVSILDLPGFGSMFHSFTKKDACESSPWSYQLNMALYNELTKRHNLTWSEAWKWNLLDNCRELVHQWGEYVKDPELNPFPPSVLNNTFFNFTRHIKEDMTTFLETQRISTQNTNESYWSDVATKVFSEANSNTYVEKNGYYDRLIMDCVFKEPLLSHEPNQYGGCRDFYDSLTSNGLCQSFNGIVASQMWKENWKNSEIMQTFSKGFGGFEPQTKLFRGIGRSEGMYMNL